MARETDPDLPKVSFEKIEDEVSTQPEGVSDLQARSYGFNDFSSYQRPVNYIRHIEPLESDLARQVEYDMDEQDKVWLDAVNAERKKEQLNAVSYEIFEIIMDRLEKEWFDLTKNIIKPDFGLPSEDSTCAICDDSEGENSNAIVFCDGCNLAVHQDCYGVPYIPEGQWLCRKCTVSPENPVSCILCPNEGGAFKQTVHGEWVHLLCAIWVPETRVANEVFMEPITGVERISKQRWKLRCSICDIREGACIQCAKTSCFLAFHTTCARRERLLMPMKSAHGSEPVTLTCYCERHLPKEQQEARAAAIAAEQSQVTSQAKLTKAARAYAKTYKPGPPLVPAIIVDRIAHYISKVVIRKKLDFLYMICRYWSLKREARRGAPLLKRLHLEPWTANAGGKIESEEEKRMKLDLLRRIREDLERVKALTWLTKSRETRKLHQAQVIQDVVQEFFLVHERFLRDALGQIMNIDRHGYFRNPVSKAEVPDYFDVVKKPMYWAYIEAKLDKHEYWDLKTFKDDVNLVVDNALLYNKPGTVYHKLALRIRLQAQSILAKLDGLVLPSANSKNGDAAVALESENLEHAVLPVGDLEPPLEVLKLLTSADTIRDELEIVIKDDDVLTSLLSYEKAELKPPPPPKPPKPKRDRRPEYEKRKKDKQAARAAEAAKAQEIQAQIQLSSGRVLRSSRTTGPAAPAAEPPAQYQAAAPQEGGEEAEVQSVTASTSRGGTVPRKRPSSVSEAPPVVSSLDNRGLFQMFHKGWILPPEQRRGGRPPLEKQAPGPPRKKARTDESGSRLSVVSTTASENPTLQPPFPESEQEVTEVETQKPEPSRDEKPISQGHRVAKPSGRTQLDSYNIIPPANVIQAANGTIILEELDTPAIRREKALRRRMERERVERERVERERQERELRQRDMLLVAKSSSLAGPGVPGPAFFEPSAPSPTPSVGPSRRAAQRLEDQEATGLESLSPLSEVASPGEDTSAKLAKKAPPTSSVSGRGRPSRSTGVEPGVISLPNGKMLEGGTLVWAKAETYPWWPAVIFEPDDPRVPPKIVKHYEDIRQRRKSVVHVLQFFDKNKTWQCLTLDKLREFGEHEELDQDLIATNSRRQKWKSAASREECREAYRKARAEMETASNMDADSGVELEEEPAVTNE